MVTWETVDSFQVCDCLSCWSDRKCLQWIWRHLRNLRRRRGGVTENTSQLGGWEKTHMNGLNGFWSSWSQTQAWGVTYKGGLWSWILSLGAVAKWGKTVTGFWMMHRAEGLALDEKKGTFDFVMDMVMITVRTVLCFFWRSCFGGQPAWHEHRFGYVNSVCTPPPLLSSVFTLENAKFCQSLLLHAQRRWRNYRNLFFWCGATCSVRLVSWLKCFFSGYPLYTDCPLHEVVRHAPYT